MLPAMKSNKHILLAWPLSLYSAKTRAYLHYKDIPFEERPVRLWDFPKIKKRVGAQVMPVVITPKDEWLQDTADIMDWLEDDFPNSSVSPSTPKQRLVSDFLEVWGDELWVPSAMHYRWNFEENFFQQFRPEGGDLLLPFAPRLIKNQVINRTAKMLRGYLPALGVTSDQIPAIETWTEIMLDHLDEHFSEHDYLLGSKPCRGDFGLLGPLYAHLGRDLYPKRALIDQRRYLSAWIRRMNHPDAPNGGEFLSGDQVPETLLPILRSVTEELFPWAEKTQVLAQQSLPELKSGRGFARAVGKVEVSLAGRPFVCAARPFVLWKMQRIADAIRGMNRDQRDQLSDWLTEIDMPELAQWRDAPRLRRQGFYVIPEVVSA